MYFKYVVFAAISLLMNLFVILTSPFWALWAALFKIKVLPYPFSLLHTHDDWIYGHGWEKPDVPPSFFERLKIAIWWLCRNPAYGFDAYILGFETEGSKIVQKNDYRWDMTAKDGKRYFSYRRDIPLFGKRYIKTWFGWHFEAKDGKTHMLKFDINPFKVKK